MRTTLAWLLLQNLTLSDKQIDARIETEYGVFDPQFQRVRGTLLGLPIVVGNDVQTLTNGDEIFPAVL